MDATRFERGDLCNFVGGLLSSPDKWTNLHVNPGDSGHDPVRYGNLSDQLVEVFAVDTPYGDIYEVYFFAFNRYYYATPKEIQKL